MAVSLGSAAWCAADTLFYSLENDSVGTSLLVEWTQPGGTGTFLVSGATADDAGPSLPPGNPWSPVDFAATADGRFFTLEKADNEPPLLVEWSQPGGSGTPLNFGPQLQNPGPDTADTVGFAATSAGRFFSLEDDGVGTAQLVEWSQPGGPGTALSIVNTVPDSGVSRTGQIGFAANAAGQFFSLEADGPGTAKLVEWSQPGGPGTALNLVATVDDSKVTQNTSLGFAAVPEPSTAMLALMGIIGLVFCHRLRKR